MALLEVNKMTHYFGGLKAVSDFNLALEEGEFLGLIGPNGAGKTTVFNLVCGFYNPSKGDIRFAGESIKGIRPHLVTSKGIARTFQNIRMWESMSVFDNLCISQHSNLGYGFLSSVLGTGKFRRGEKKVHRTAEELIEILGLKEYRDEIPGNLPYGLQRRVEIGRALTVKPKLLLLDEPAAGMNQGEIEQLIELIGWVRKEFNLTIWLIEHQMKVVMSLCDRIKVVNFGETIADGSPEEIRSNPEVIKAYLGDDGVVNA